MFIRILISTVFIYSLIFLSSNHTNAQSRIAVEGIHAFSSDEESGPPSELKPLFRSISSNCIGFLSSNKNFTVIDRANRTVVEAEIELQKSEDFMDGYMVEQGKSEGVDYIFKPYYQPKQKLLILKVYNIESETVHCTRVNKLNTSWWGSMNMDNQVNILLHELLYDCFDIKFPVVRNSKSSGGKSHELLCAIGKSNKLSDNNNIDIFIYEEEIVMNQSVQRLQVLGRGKLKKIIDQNFSEVKVDKGKKEIFAALESGQSVFVRVVEN